jgi:IS6 family transposase
MGTRPAIFKWRQTEAGLLLCAVRWYLRYSLSLRDVEELLEERGLYVDHTTVWRWVQYHGPELEQRLRQHLKPTRLPSGSFARRSAIDPIANLE